VIHCSSNPCTSETRNIRKLLTFQLLTFNRHRCSPFRPSTIKAQPHAASQPRKTARLLLVRVFFLPIFRDSPHFSSDVFTCCYLLDRPRRPTIGRQGHRGS